MALAGEELRVREIGGPDGDTSLCRDTTHARFAGEVDEKVRSLMAHSPADRSSSEPRGSEGWKRLMRHYVSWILPVRIRLPQPANQVSATRFPGAAEVSTFQRVRLIRASLCGLVQRQCAGKGPVSNASLRVLIFNFRFGMPETGSTVD